MDKSVFMELLMGGTHPIIHLLMRFVAFVVYFLFLKRVCRMHFFLALFVSFPLTIFFPLVLFVPSFVLGWAVYRIYALVRSLFKKSQVVLDEVQDSPEGFLFSVDDKNVLLENPYRGIYIQGGAGSGKTISLIHPIVIQAVAKNYSGICYDFKSPELTQLLFANLKKGEGIVRPYFIDFKEARRSARTNPLQPELLPKIAYAHEYAQTLMYNLSPKNIKNEDYWMMEAKSVLTGLIWYLKSEHPKYCSLLHVISLILHTDISQLLERISADPEASGFMASLNQAIQNEASNQLTGVVSTLRTNLAKLNTPDIFWILSGDDLDLNINDPLNPKFLCIGNESTLAETYAPVISLLISVSLKQMNQPGKHKAVVLVDELPTLYINKLEQTPATARSNKVATVLACQDFSQLVDRYGRDKAQVMLSNMGNQFYGRTVNKDSAQMITHIFGKADKTFKTTSHGDNYYQSSIFGKHTNSLNKSTNETVQERDRVKTTDIMNLRPGEFYGLIAEGNEREILKSEFGINKRLGDSGFDFPIRASDLDIQENYQKIIWQAKSIFEPMAEKDESFIRF
ncbi:type IV secretory system conjugative DNA transfer family protein [Maribacter flavus]|uniref:Type IV secretory system conjugative DNA transfer family protein n=1 Tax=Maribacter flavus TaxID=1658664 RepID=A0A5B2TVG9_9FLAO|nr:type IV secretion system DNA-binding domain-containing protein [Maribacter flavus]KAA2218516.1 type IV secretory system conjugative DNA transfer family protein [Maribacter flavus]